MKSNETKVKAVIGSTDLAKTAVMASEITKTADTLERQSAEFTQACGVDHATSYDSILSHHYTRIVVEDLETHQEIAVITNEEISTASDSIIVRLLPRYD